MMELRRRFPEGPTRTARCSNGGIRTGLRRLVLEAAGAPMNAADDAICLCSHAWCVNPQHLTRSNADERRAFDRSGWIDLGTLWATRQLLAEQVFTENDMANDLNVSAALLRNAISRLQTAKSSVHIRSLQLIA